MYCEMKRQNSSSSHPKECRKVSHFRAISTDQLFCDGLFEILMVLEGGSTIIFDLSRVILWICRFFMAHSTEILRGFSWEFSGSWRNEVKNSKLIPYSYSLTSSSTVMNISWELVKTLITGMYHCIRTV